VNVQNINGKYLATHFLILLKNLVLRKHTTFWIRIRAHFYGNSNFEKKHIKENKVSVFFEVHLMGFCPWSLIKVFSNSASSEIVFASRLPRYQMLSNFSCKELLIPNSATNFHRSPCPSQWNCLFTWNYANFSAITEVTRPNDKYTPIPFHTIPYRFIPSNPIPIFVSWPVAFHI